MRETQTSDFLTLFWTNDQIIPVMHFRKFQWSGCKNRLNNFIHKKYEHWTDLYFKAIDGKFGVRRIDTAS